MFFGWVTVCCAMVQAKCLHTIVSLFLGHSRHSGGRAATHQVLDSYAILEQRIGRQQHDGSSEWKTPRVWDCSSHFSQNGEAEDHPASP